MSRKRLEEAKAGAQEVTAQPMDDYDFNELQYVKVPRTEMEQEEEFNRFKEY